MQTYVPKGCFTTLYLSAPQNPLYFSLLNSSIYNVTRIDSIFLTLNIETKDILLYYLCPFRIIHFPSTRLMLPSAAPAVFMRTSSVSHLPRWKIYWDISMAAEKVAASKIVNSIPRFPFCGSTYGSVSPNGTNRNRFISMERYSSGWILASIKEWKG